MTSPVSVTTQSNIAIISIANPPVNAISQAVRQRLLEAAQQINSDAAIRAVVLICQGRTFIAGADISEFGRPPLAPHLPDVLQALTDCSKPIVAALHGTALGGGLEVALACHYRVALKSTKIGLPEINLGLLPGAGGTQLLPRLLGVETALKLISSGQPVAAAAPAIDKIIEGDLQTEALAYAQTLIDSNATPRRLREVILTKAANHDELFATWRTKLSRSRRGQPAAGCCIQSVENAVLLPFEEGLAAERRLFLECKNSPESAAMRHAFFAERQAARVEGIDKHLQPQAINSVGVVGGGTMGAGIAVCCLDAGIPVRLIEATDIGVTLGLDRVHKLYKNSVSKGRLSQQEYENRMTLITGSYHYADLADVDLVIEAAFENQELKQQIFSQLAEVCRPDAILASNTSYLDINAMAAATNSAHRVLGLHFFSPANVMKLLEIVRLKETSQQTLLTALALGKRIRKITAVVGDCYGFAGNRMYSCYSAAAQQLLLEGATPEQVDNAMCDWGMAMGPLSVGDLSGLDIGYKARRAHPNPPADPSWFKPANIMVEAGRVGQKVDRGFYNYSFGSKQVDETAVAMIRAAAAELGIKQQNHTAADIQQRTITALINEGRAILAEGIVQRASDIDVIWLNGYGFPRFRGGPMYYAEVDGL